MLREPGSFRRWLGSNIRSGMKKGAAKVSLYWKPG
jgi:hypothetical protein